MMKIILFTCLMVTGLSLNAAENCKTVKDCALWITAKTGEKYELGKYERRSLRVEKDFLINEGNPEFIFNFIMQSNDFARIKRDSGYQIIQAKEIKDFTFPSVKSEEIPATLDFYSLDYTLGSNEKVKNAIVIIKKYLSKNGRVMEVANTPQVQIIDTGIQLNMLKVILTELNK